MDRKHSAGKGDRYRPVDQRKWDAGWAHAFPQHNDGKGMNRTEYVVCFVFNLEQTRVVLVHKQTGPAAVIGHWNGVGGKIEKTETHEQTSSREFLEETGVPIDDNDWNRLGTLVGPSYTLHFLWAVSELAEGVITNEHEPIAFVDIHMLPKPIMSNVHWMIHMILDDNISEFGTIKMARG